MGSKVEAPEPTAEEKMLQSEQAELLRQQRSILLEQGRLQNLLLPIFGAQSGIDFQFDAKGNIIGAKRNQKHQQQEAIQQEFLEMLQEQLREQRERQGEEGPLRDLQLEVEMGLAKRSLAALKGELPVDPALEREISTQERTLRDTLRQQLGAGYETSTPGIEALQRFGEGAAALRSGAQTGQLTLAEQLGVARTALRTGQNSSDLQQPLAGFSNLSQLGFGQQASQQQAIFGPQMALAGGLGQVAGGFGVAQVPFQQQRSMEFQADIFNAQNSGIGALGGLFGGILGALPFSSDNRLKKWWVQIGTLENGVPLYLFEYVWGEQAIGVLAQDVPWATSERDGYLVVDYEKVN